MAQKSPFTSCIYIGGFPILPPLVTAEIRQEMQKYREMATEIEKKISQRKNPLNQSETTDSKSDPVTPVSPKSPNTCPADTVPSQEDSTVLSQEEEDSHKPDDDTNSEKNPSPIRSVRRNSYTLETPSPQLMALLKSNQIKDVSCNLDSKSSESESDVSEVTSIIVTEKLRSPPYHCYNAGSSLNCPNQEGVTPKSSRLGVTSTSSDCDSLSSDVESIVINTESIDPSIKEESSAISLQLCPLDSCSHESFQSEPATNAAMCNSSIKSFGSANDLDTSVIKDLKLASNDESWQKSQTSVRNKNRNLSLVLRKTFLTKNGLNKQETGSLSLPTSLCSSPEPQHSFLSTENLFKESPNSKIPPSTKIPRRYHKLSEKSQCAFKNTTVRNQINEAKKVGRIKQERLYSSLIEDKFNISDDSKSILNQSKLPVYMPLRRSSLGFIPFKIDTILKRKPTNFCRRPVTLRKSEFQTQTSVDNHKNLNKSSDTKENVDSVNHSNMPSKNIVIDENKNMNGNDTITLDQSLQNSLHLTDEDITLSPVSINSRNLISIRRTPDKSRLRSFLSDKSPSLSNNSMQDKNSDDIFLHYSPSYTNSDVESLNDENSLRTNSLIIIEESPETDKEQQSNVRVISSMPTMISDMTNNNVSPRNKKTRPHRRSWKELNFYKNGETEDEESFRNNTSNSFYEDTISLSGSESIDISVVSNKGKETNEQSDTDISERGLTVLLEELNNKHQQQMELLKQKQIEEQNILEEQQKKITETILLNLSSSLSPTSKSPRSEKSDNSPKATLNYDEIPVNKGLINVSPSDSSNVTLFSSTPSSRPTSSSLSRYSLPNNPSRILPNKIWFMNNIPTTKFHPKDSYNDLEIKAATVIQAAVRGFLVRRLLKTERVQLLIEMIQKSIKCAFEIQQELSPSLADYEFHARLVQQITKACYEIHEIFMVYPQKEQFSIIDADRLKKLQKSNNSTPVPKPLSVATRRSLQRKFSQSSTDSSNLTVKKPHRARSHTFTSSSINDANPRRRRYERSATTLNMRKPQRLSYDSRVTKDLKRRVPWR